MNKLVLAGVLIGAAGLACAEDVPSVTTNNSIITFYVPEAQTLTYDGSLTYPAVKGFEKTGGGTLVMTTAATSFDSKNANQYIREGILEEQVKGAVGAYNNLYISDGAQLYLNFESGNQSDYSPIPTYIKGIAGSGPDGTGAIRIGDKVTSNWSSFIRNEFTLTGDTTIQCDNKTMTGFSTSSTLNLRGHTLTFNGKANLWFGRNATNGSGPIVDPGAGGGIVNNMTNNTYFYNLTTFKGDATSTFEITAGSILYLNSLANPFPWKLKNSQKKLQYNVQGSLGRQYNVLAGPIEYVGENEFGGTSGCSITFRGRIKFIGTAGVDPDCWRINGSGTQIYFDSRDPQPSKFKISMSGEADCYYLTDTSLPRWDAEDGFYYFSGPAQYNTRNCELWLGAEGTNEYCTGLGVARAIESFGTWCGYTTSRQLRFRTFGDFTADTDVTVEKNQDLFEMVHTGFGTLDFAGAFPTSDAHSFHYRNIETNETVFSGGHDRKALSLFVDKGTVRVKDGSMLVRNNMSIGGSNDSANPTLVVGKGALLHPAHNGLEIRSYETGSKPALLKVEEGALVTNKFISTYASAAEREAGKVYKAAVNQYGDVMAWSGGYIGNWCGLGFWGVGGGTLNIDTSARLLGQAGTRGLFQQDGGTVEYKKETLMQGDGGRNDYLMRGGSFFGEKTFYMAYTSDCSNDKPGDFTSFTMMGDDAVFNAPMSFNSRTNAYPTVFNLNGGRFIPKSLGTTRAVAQNPNYFNFNGGTLVWKAALATRMWNTGGTPTAITIYEKGGTIEIERMKDTSLGTASAIFESDRVALAGEQHDYLLDLDNTLVIRPLSGRGVKSVKIPADMPRSGYVGIMPVRITGGDGEGFTAALDFDMKTGTIAEDLLVTCSGIDYTNAPTVIAYGPDYETEYVCTVELTDDDRVAGPLVKTGPGSLILKASRFNTFAGPYIISNGTIMANYNCMIPEHMHVRLAGGTFNWDWRSITLGTLGGYGSVMGNLSDTAAHSATVTDAFVCDAADLDKGLFLKIRDEGDGYCDKQSVGFGPDCVVRIEHPELLDKSRGYTLFRQKVRINRKPQLDPSLAEEFRLSLRNGGKELWLVGRFGYSIIIK